MRILILIAIGLLLYIIITTLLRKAKAEDEQARMEKIVRCEQCGLHISEHEAIQQNHHYFCSTQHLEAFNESK